MHIEFVTDMSTSITTLYKKHVIRKKKKLFNYHLHCILELTKENT